MVSDEGVFQFAALFQARAFDESCERIGLALRDAVEREIGRGGEPERIIQRARVLDRNGAGGERSGRSFGPERTRRFGVVRE